VIVESKTERKIGIPENRKLLARSERPIEAVIPAVLSIILYTSEKIK
jgi:hypothetical protein